MLKAAVDQQKLIIIIGTESKLDDLLKNSEVFTIRIMKFSAKIEKTSILEESSSLCITQSLLQNNLN